MCNHRHSLYRCLSDEEPKEAMVDERMSPKGWSARSKRRNPCRLMESFDRCQLVEDVRELPSERALARCLDEVVEYSFDDLDRP